MPFYDYIRILGISSDYPSAENVQGIGAVAPGSSGSVDNPINVTGNFTTTQAQIELDPAWLTCLDTWQTDFGTWVTECETIINDAEVAMAAGEEYEAAEFPEIPALNLPVPLPPGTPPAIIIIIRLFEMGLILWEMPIVRHIVRRITRRIGSGGQADVFLRMFRKFAFLREGEDIKPTDYTSLLLLNADKPIEIIDSLGNRDVFLDTDTLPDD